ncbi:MAG: hypothetical protein OQL08_08355 [Gammaproteobacteria bacterium]|nr:hypothetical protein [Gammaproteobacteria bacterium]
MKESLTSRLSPLAVLVLVIAGCGRDAPSPSRALFEEQVVPLLEQRCLACHGVAADRYAAFMADGNEGYFYLPTTPANRIADPATAFEVTRGHHRVAYGEEARFSHILRAPLAEEYGGVPHKGLDIFYSTEDADYQTLHRWVELELAEHPEPSASLAEHKRLFRDQVQPTLVRNGCFLSSCHGPLSFTDFKLQPPLPDGSFSNAMTAENRQAALGKLTRLVNLGGELKRSRLLVKNLPIAAGGVHQRGGNNQFFEGYDDEDVKQLLQWMALEREALFARLTIGGKPLGAARPGEVKGTVFIRGPRHAPRRYFELDPFYPGANIFLFDGERERPLTRYKEAEIQSLDVSYDARKVLFAMRRSETEGFRLHELDLASGTVTQLSFDAARLADGTLLHHIDPIYTPGQRDEHDLSDVAISYASNRAGGYVASGPWGLLGEADTPPGAPSQQVVFDRQRPERTGSFNGRRLHFVKGPNTGEWRTIRRHERHALELDRPLPHAIDIRSHYVIEQPRHYASAYDIWRFIPGEFAASHARMTWGLNQERRPTVRSSGEVMATTVRNLGYQDDKPVFNGAIFRMQAGGFDFHPHSGERSQYGLHSDSREMPEGLELKALHDPRNYWGGGQLALVDHGLGATTEPNNPVDAIPLTERFDEVNFSSLPRYISELVTFDSKVTHTGLSPGGAFRDPYPLPDGSILVAHTDQPLDHLDPNADPDWDIWQLRFDGSLQDEDRHRIGAYKKTRMEKISTKLAEYNPRPLVVRLQENRHHPLAHQKFVAGHEPQTIFGVQRMAEGTPAEIEVYDFHLLSAFLTNFTQTGRRDIPPPPAIKYVRALGLLPLERGEVEGIRDADPHATAASKGVHGKKLIIGEVALEPDSSVYLQVPPNVPWIVQALDQERRALFTLQRQFYTQPGERFTLSIPRSKFLNTCGGCHGSLTADPMESIGPADITTEASRVMATWNPQEQRRREPVAKGATIADFIAIDFVRDIQPLLDRHCVRCHQGDGLDLRGTPTRHYSVAYESLHQLRDPASGNFADKKYINEREALSSQSPLIDKLLGDGHRYLDDDELLTLIRWIDIGATFKGAW